MTRDMWTIRGVELALAAAVIALVWTLVNAHVFRSGVDDFTTWWAKNVNGIFAVEVVSVSDGAPGPGSTPDRLDVGLTEGMTSISSEGVISQHSGSEDAAAESTASGS